MSVHIPKLKHNSRRRTTSQFIDEARTIHGDRYNYSLSNYVNVDTKITIICAAHGEFQQTPYNHLNGSNCNKCLNRKLSSIEYIQKANKVHNGIYDYEKVKFIGNKHKIIITCRVHGDFLQSPGDHIAGKGCINCGAMNNGLRSRSDTETFIHKSQRLHGEKYIYDKVHYVRAHDPVTIICKKHGEFCIKPNYHLSGDGCKWCSKEAGMLTKAKLGLNRYPTDDMTLYEVYRAHVWKFTERNYKLFKSIINPLNKNRGRREYHIDHVVSMITGWHNDVPPEIIGHYSNLQMLSAHDNVVKQTRNGKTLEQLYLDFQLTQTTEQGKPL